MFELVSLVDSGENLVVILSLKIPPHLKCVASLPCEMLLSGANYRSISLITPLVSGVTGLNASFGSKVDTLNIDVKTAGCDSYFRQ